MDRPIDDPHQSSPHQERDAIDGRRVATKEELETLPRVVDSLPVIVWIALVAGAAERFTFYAVSTPWQNYIQNGPNSKGLPGALGLGQATATSIGNAFYLGASLTPIPFAIVSDAWLGRYITLLISLILNLCGCLILFVTSLPLIKNEATKIAGLAIALALMGLGNGGVRATVSPFIGDQYAMAAPESFSRKGKRVIADRELTMQYIYNIFYWFTNIASLSSLVAATYLEKYVGFWAAYLLPLCSFWISLPSLILWNKSLVKLPSQGNIVPQAGRVVVYSLQDKSRLEAAKPAFQKAKYGRQVPWDDHFVEEIKQGLKAFQVMSCFVPFYLCLSQMTNNLVSQAGEMQLSGVPNDMIQMFNDIGCILLGPIFQKIIYPTLKRYNISFKPITRMTWSFISMSAAMAYAAGVQKMIYNAGPCYDEPLACPASQGGALPNDISVWLQIPIYFLLSASEILGFTTLSEFSYSEAPKNMRAFVQALRQISSGVGAALALALSRVSTDPKILYVYAGLSSFMIASVPVFSFYFRNYKEKEDIEIPQEEMMEESRQVTDIERPPVEKVQ